MSDLTMAVLDWASKLHEITGVDPHRIVVPQRAFEMLASELMREPIITDGDPISGVDLRGRIWLACCEIVPDVRCPVGGCEETVPHMHSSAESVNARLQLLESQVKSLQMAAPKGIPT